jgi:hypothetical protein
MLSGVIAPEPTRYSTENSEEPQTSNSQTKILLVPAGSLASAGGAPKSDNPNQLNSQELAHLKSQIVISNDGRGGPRHSPYAFN